MSTPILGKLQFFLSVEWWMYRCALGTSLGSISRLLRQKMQRSLPERQTERKNRCPRLPRHTGHPQLKYGKASATTAWKTKSTRTPSLVSPYEKTGDSRFAPNLLPYTGVRAVFFGVTCAVVRKVYGTGSSRGSPWRIRKSHIVPQPVARAVFSRLFESLPMMNFRLGPLPSSFIERNQSDKDCGLGVHAVAILTFWPQPSGLHRSNC